MTTVGSLSGDLAPGSEASRKANMDLLPSPTNSVPYIIATAADGVKTEAIVAPIHGGSPMRYLQASSKLDQEPNPFEQSFSGASDKTGSGGAGGAGVAGAGSKVETPKPVLPSIASMSGRLAPGTDQFGWDAQSLRMGPLSPSMLEGPQNPIVFEKDTASLPLPIGSFPPPVPNSMAAVLVNNGFANVPGPLPAPSQAAPLPAHSNSNNNNTSESYPPAPGYNQSQPPAPAHPHMQQHLGPPRSHQQQMQQPQPPQQQQYSHHPSDRYMPPASSAQGQHHGQPHSDMNGYGNLHLLSQAQAAHREHWIKRESADSNNGSAPLGQHPHPHPHGPQSNPQSHPQHIHSQQQQSGPHHNGHQQQHHSQQQHHPGMASMSQGHQNGGGEPTFVRRVNRRSRAETEDSEDSEISDKSGKNGQGSESGSNKRQATGQGVTGTGDEKVDEEEKRKNFLERNRQAALKCRQRKKQWLSNLQAKVEYLSTDNEHLQAQTVALRDEIIHLKALLLAHKDCPVAQANGVYADSISMPGPQGHPMGQHGRQPHAQQQMQGRPGPGLGPQHRGPMPPHPQQQPQYQQGPTASMQNGVPPPSMAPIGGGRPMSMMQDITPNASPSQAQVNGRY
ncbi:hypothetical protein BGZ83_008443 [Gryganskiella cystojenkinii]|nr:hypothetical protein BGZ83_008443 [Gryganskiella cystojenkinii]